jgi:hypothetical protein
MTANPGAESLSKSTSSRRRDLVEQTLLREKFQNAIYQLIREYELAAHMSVIRVEYQPDQQRIMIDALPATS